MFNFRMRYPPYTAKKDSWVEWLMAKKPQKEGIRGFWPFTFLAMIFAAVVAVSYNKSWLDLALFMLDHFGIKARLGWMDATTAFLYSCSPRRVSKSHESRIDGSLQLRKIYCLALASQQVRNA